MPIIGSVRYLIIRSGVRDLLNSDEHSRPAGTLHGVGFVISSLHEDSLNNAKRK